MKETIQKLSNERLESEIANIYWAAHEVSPGKRLQETGLLADLWNEFDVRLASGTIDANPLTGMEPDRD